MMGWWLVSCGGVPPGPSVSAGCFQVGWGGGFVVLCSGCEVGWLGGFMLVCGLGGLGVLLLAVGSPVLWVLLGCGLCVWVVFLGLVAGWV